jgi:hypothetical protein
MVDVCGTSIVNTKAMRGFPQVRASSPTTRGEWFCVRVLEGVYNQGKESDELVL